jgi:predicted metal-dependent phosphoesterase TrpH
MYESLHNHTRASDGTQTHAEVLASAARLDYGIMAFTDHDTLPTTADMKRLREYDGPVKWIVGCEVSSGLPVELGTGPSSSVHILGLFTDPTNDALRGYCKQAQAARVERMQRMVANLKNLGFTISVDDCVRESGGETVARPHVVRALNGHAENAAVIEKMRADMELEAVQSAVVAMDYARMLERPASDYPYRLFLSDDAYVPGVYVDSLYWVDLDKAVELIRGAGGLAVIAHWYTAEKKINAQKLQELLIADRIDGAEILGNPLNPQARRAEPVVQAIIERTGKIATWGADSHRESELENFVNNKMVAQRTVGQTKTIIERLKPDLSASSL